MTSESSSEYGVEFRVWQGQEKEHFKCVWMGGGLHEKTGKYWMKQSWWGLWPYWIVVVIQLLSHVQLFVTAWTAACQASLSFTIFWSLLKLMSIESMIPSNHLILSPTSPALNLSQHLGLFEWVGFSHQVAKLLELQLQHQSFQWIIRLISFRIDWFDLHTQEWNNMGYNKWKQHGNDRGRCWLRGFDNTYSSSSKEKLL